MDPEELVARARVVALPMVERFRGITVREALLIEGADGRWAEWSPFVEYGDPEASTWLRATLEELRPPAASAAPGASSCAGSTEFRAPSAGRCTRRDVRVNATVPAVPPEAVPGVLARFPGCRTAKVKVAERGQSLADDLARVAAVREALGPDGRIRVDANGLWALDEAETALRALPNSDNLKAGARISLNERRRIFRQIIVKCVLQLLLIETTNDLLRNDEVYDTIPPEHLLRLMGVLDHSYQFARMFNDDKELRTGLWKVGQ